MCCLFCNAPTTTIIVVPVIGTDMAIGIETCEEHNPMREESFAEPAGDPRLVAHLN